MEAEFSQPLNVIEAAARRAGLKFDIGNELGSVRFLSKQGSQVTLVSGCANSIMRLIGALADDGQDCLVFAR